MLFHVSDVSEQEDELSCFWSVLSILACLAKKALNQAEFLLNSFQKVVVLLTYWCHSHRVDYWCEVKKDSFCQAFLDEFEKGNKHDRAQ